jgi:hypothetical protein
MMAGGTIDLDEIATSEVPDPCQQRDNPEAATVFRIARE